MKTGVLQYPCQHSAGCGLAVRACYGQNPFPRQHMTGQKLRPRTVVQPAIQYILNGRITTRHGITDNHQIRMRLQVLRLEPVTKRNALLFQLGAHRRINVGIGPTHLEAQLPRQDRQTAHERSANAEYMNMHRSSCNLLLLETSLALARPSATAPKPTPNTVRRP